MPHLFNSEMLLRVIKASLWILILLIPRKASSSNGDHSPLKAKSNNKARFFCRAPSEEIYPGSFVVYLQLGYSSEDHYSTVKKDIKPYTRRILTQLHPKQVVYRGWDITDDVLDAIRSDKGVESVHCDTRVHWFSLDEDVAYPNKAQDGITHEAKLECNSSPDRNIPGSFKIHFYPGYKLDEHSAAINADMKPRVCAIQKAGASQDHDSYIGQDISDKLLQSIREDHRVEVVKCVEY